MSGPTGAAPRIAAAIGSNPLLQALEGDPVIRDLRDPRRRPCGADIERCVEAHHREARVLLGLEPRGGEAEVAHRRAAPTIVAQTIVHLSPTGNVVTDRYVDGTQDVTLNASATDPRLVAARELFQFGANDLLARSGRPLVNGRLEERIDLMGGEGLLHSPLLQGAGRMVARAADHDGDGAHDQVIVLVERGAQRLIVDFSLPERPTVAE